MSINISGRGVKSVHGELFEKMFGGMRKNMKTIKKKGSENIMIVFCPDYKRIDSEARKYLV